MSPLLRAADEYRAVTLPINYYICLSYHISLLPEQFCTFEEPKSNQEAVDMRKYVRRNCIFFLHDGSDHQLNYKRFPNVFIELLSAAKINHDV